MDNKGSSPGPVHGVDNSLVSAKEGVAEGSGQYELKQCLANSCIVFSVSLLR